MFNFSQSIKELSMFSSAIVFIQPAISEEPDKSEMLHLVERLLIVLKTYIDSKKFLAGSDSIS